jgi:hypothetical protein
MDPILYSVGQFGKPGRQALWGTLADRWPDEMNAVIAQPAPFFYRRLRAAELKR